MNLLRQAVKAYPRHDLASKKTVAHLRHEWIKKVNLLGDKWLLAKANFVQRKGS